MEKMRNFRLIHDDHICIIIIIIIIINIISEISEENHH
jgi:hypothetical protein